MGDQLRFDSGSLFPVKAGPLADGYLTDHLCSPRLPDFFLNHGHRCTKCQKRA